MPQQIEVDGVGTFEVDDSFFNMTDEQQQAAIGQMVEADKQGITASEDYSGPPTGFENGVVERRFEDPYAALTAPNELSQGDEVTNQGPGIVTRSMGAFNEGLADTLGAPVDLATMGLNKLGLDIKDPVLGSKSISGILHKIGIGQVDDSYKPQSIGEEYLQAAARGTGQALPGALAVPLAGARLATPLTTSTDATLASATKEGIKSMAREAAQKPALAVATEAGAGAGSGVGAKAAQDMFPDSEIAPVLGSLLGGLTGATAVGIPGSNLSKYGVKPKTRFVNKQLEKNPFAAYDAEIAQDIAGLTTDTARSALDPKGRATVTAKSINNLEQSYQGRFKEMLNALDIPQSDKMNLRQLLDSDYSAAMAKVDALRGTVPGDAFADAIIKTQRLRHLTPELRPGGPAGTLKKALDLVGTAGGLVTGGPSGALGGYGGSKLIQKVLSSVGDGEAARVNAAEKLIKRAPKYKALQEQTGPSGAIESKAALEDAYGATVTAKEETKKAVQAAREAKAKADAQAKLDAAAQRQENTKLGIRNAKDNITPSGGYRKFLYDNTGLDPATQDIAVLRMASQKLLSKQQVENFLKDSNKLMPGNAGNAIMDRMNAMAENGELPRDPKWVKPQAVPESRLPTAGIRNPIAYEATAKANQQRVSETLAAVHASPDLPDSVKQTVAEAVTRLGNTSNSADADAIVSQVRQAIGDQYKDYAARLLAPLAAQIK